ncbi:MAG TPA: prolipoprotein diacylglyceryl transferase [Gemmatimonadales bacterium]|jgi:phosphatidylglycerol:prolipoprotein diacylglycerol transferase|nr:prolipoprotein diacylglyceryl transferase [Gemmatimonadales bacterium]
MTTVYPFNLHLGPLNLTGYGLMLMVGFLVGGWLIDRALRARGWYHEYAADITVAAVIGGVVGAKLWYVVATGEWSSLISRGGLVWYGGFLGGTAAVLLNGARLKVPMRWTLELAAPALPAAYALGRVGCFLVEDDYGVPSTLPWSVKFPQGLPATTAGAMAHDFGIPIQAGVSPDTLLAVHPTQLYEVVLMTAAFMLLWRLRGHRRATGWLFGLYLALAGTERFLVEFVRAKEDHLGIGLTLAQVMALGLVALGGVLLAKWGSGEALAPGEYLKSGTR